MGQPLNNSADIGQAIDASLNHLHLPVVPELRNKLRTALTGAIDDVQKKVVASLQNPAMQAELKKQIDSLRTNLQNSSQKDIDGASLAASAELVPQLLKDAKARSAEQNQPPVDQPEPEDKVPAMPGHLPQETPAASPKAAPTKEAPTAHKPAPAPASPSTPKETPTPVPPPSKPAPAAPKPSPTGNTAPAGKPGLADALQNRLMQDPNLGQNIGKAGKALGGAMKNRLPKDIPGLPKPGRMANNMKNGLLRNPAFGQAGKALGAMKNTLPKGGPSLPTLPKRDLSRKQKANAAKNAQAKDLQKDIRNRKKHIVANNQVSAREQSISDRLGQSEQMTQQDNKNQQDRAAFLGTTHSKGSIGRPTEAALRHFALNKADQMGAATGKKLQKNINSGSITSMYFALSIAVVLDFVDVGAAVGSAVGAGWIAWGIACFIKAFFYAAIIYILLGTRGQIKANLLYWLLWFLSVFFVELAPIVNAFPTWTVSILFMIYSAWQDRRKQKEHLKKLEVQIKKIKKMKAGRASEREMNKVMQELEEIDKVAGR